MFDRWAGYNWLPSHQRQLCWAHLKRNWQGWVDLNGRGKVYGEKLLTLTSTLFKAHHSSMDGKLAECIWLRKSRSLRETGRRLLQKARYYGSAKIRGMAKKMLSLEDSIWTFCGDKKIAPTNNHAERTIRPAVLLRKGSFGTDSVGGSRFVSRMLSVAASLRMQGRTLLDFVTQAIKSTVEEGSSPSLLPAPTA